MNFSQSFSSLACHCVMKLSNGEYVCWGSNENGSLGIQSTREPTTPQKIVFEGKVVMMASGWHHTLALMDDGSVWGWGNNYIGQLGLGDKIDRHVPTRIPMPNGLPVSGIACAADTGYAFTEDGTLFAWGENCDGQLGDGTRQKVESPQKVAGLAGKLQKDWRQGGKRERGKEGRREGGKEGRRARGGGRGKRSRGGREERTGGNTIYNFRCCLHNCRTGPRDGPHQKWRYLLLGL
jgi:alpha-tubulin suppressor-like RCC1 family protein